MNKVLRVLSTLMIIIGFLFLAVYINSQHTETINILSHPSYYTERSLWMMFIAGIAVLVFSVLGSFFSWFKKLDQKKEETLLNPGYASEEEIHNWVGGSSADSVKTEDTEKERLKKQTSIQYEKASLGASERSAQTELITETATEESDPEKTEIIREEKNA